MGQGEKGQLGHGNNVAQRAFLRVSTLNKCSVVAVAAGGSMSAALTGMRLIPPSPLPPFPSLTDPYRPRPAPCTSVRLCNVDLFGSPVRADSGEVYAWGCNDYGELGIGSDEPFITVPLKISFRTPSPIVSLSCGESFCAAVTGAGVFCSRFAQQHKNDKEGTAAGAHGACGDRPIHSVVCTCVNITFECFSFVSVDTFFRPRRPVYLGPKQSSTFSQCLRAASALL